MLAVAPFFSEDGARRASGFAVASVPDFVVAVVAAAAGLTAGRRLSPARDGRVQDAAAAVAVQLVEGDVGADAAVAGVTELGASDKHKRKIV